MSDRPCGCGCGEPLPPQSRGNRRYRDGHRDRAYRRRLREQSEAAGLPGSLSLKTVHATVRTQKASADAHTPRRSARRGPRPGDTVYFPPGQLEDVKAAIRAAANQGQDVAAVEQTLEAAEKRRRRRKS